MKSVIYTDFFFFLPLFMSFFYYWLLFFRFSFFSILNKKLYNETITTSSSNYSLTNVFLNKLNFIFLFSFFLYFSVYAGYEDNFWWNHFYVSNFNINLISLFFFIFSLFFFFISFFFKVIENVKNDYFFSLLLLVTFSVYIYLSNTFFTFLFLLECVSTTIFFKFISSKVWNDNQFSDIDLKQSSSFKKYINMLFFQFWSTFFSTVVLFFFLIYLVLSFGSTEWFIINYLFLTKLNFFSNVETIFFFFIFSFFLFSFFIKIGFTPIHLYKIEVYKGLTFLSIFFYTTIYFFIYFIYFLLLMFFLFNSMSTYFLYFILFVSLLSFFFLIVFMFDINYSKSFFAFSTICNSLVFLFISIISLI